jgi:hypothetical protein
MRKATSCIYSMQVCPRGPGLVAPEMVESPIPKALYCTPSLARGDHHSLLPPLIRLQNPSYGFTYPFPYSSTAHLLLDGMPDPNKLPNAQRVVSFRQIQVKDILLFTLVR